MFLTSSGNSSKSLALSKGIIIVLMPLLKAPIDFSFNPPIAKTCPLNVISPVKAKVLGILVLVIALKIAKVKAIPALGPSFFIAPSGT